MTPQPHPLRCETCDHYNGGEYFDKCKNEIFPDNMDSTERQYIKDWISSHGCASHSSRPAPSRNIDVSKCFEDIVYSSTPWKIYRQDAGMGEHDYAVFLNDVFYCRTDDSQTATRIINTMRSPAPFEPKFDSTDLLLLANDEWKRREERKHNHENAPWCAGFVNGFLTDKKWAREMVDKIQKDAEDKHRREVQE